MKEDDDQKSERNSARSFALLKRIALHVVTTKDTTPKRSLRRKLKHSRLDNNYLTSTRRKEYITRGKLGVELSYN
jgi:hypothetical protein